MKLGIRRSIWLSLGCLLVVAAAVLFSSQNSSAASSGGNGLRVSPVRSDVVVNPGETKIVNVSVTNITSAPATLQTIVNDFIAKPDESGDPAIILDPTIYAASHSLKRFVGKVPTFTLAPGQQKFIEIPISVPKSAAGGGYYGAVRFAPASVTKGPNQTVSLAGSVGSLILLKVPGNVKEQLSVASFDVRKKDSPSSFFTTNKDLAATIRFQNGGNIQEQPFGKILLKNRSGKVIQTYEINNVSPAGNVLPDSIRKFATPLVNGKTGKSSISGFGQYKLEGNFGYGSSGQLLTASTTFYVIPMSVIIAFIVIVLLVVFIVLVLPKLVRAYNRRVLSRAGRLMSKSRR